MKLLAFLAIGALATPAFPPGQYPKQIRELEHVACSVYQTGYLPMQFQSTQKPEFVKLTVWTLTINAKVDVQLAHAGTTVLTNIVHA